MRKKTARAALARPYCASSPRRCMTASPMRRADANRPALSGCTRRHSSRRTAFVDIFDGAEVIVGFNCLAFDFPLLQRFYTSKKRYLAHRCKCLDIMTRVRDVTDDYYKLVEITRQGRCEALWCRSSQRKPPKHKLRVGCARSSIRVRVGTARCHDLNTRGLGREKRRSGQGRACHSKMSRPQHSWVRSGETPLKADATFADLRLPSAETTDRKTPLAH